MGVNVIITRKHSKNTVKPLKRPKIEILDTYAEQNCGFNFSSVVKNKYILQFLAKSVHLKRNLNPLTFIFRDEYFVLGQVLRPKNLEC